MKLLNLKTSTAVNGRRGIEKVRFRTKTLEGKG